MPEEKDMTTKEKIIQISIDLFSDKGYRDVSMREIASAVGIKASSLYKHYESKEAILQSIFSQFREKIGQTSFPEEQLRQYVATISPEAYLNEAFAQFKSIMWSPEAIKTARIITREQQRNQSVREFFMQELMEKPCRLMQHVFELMMANGQIPHMDARVLAEEYSAYIIYLYFEQNFLKESLSLPEIEDKMKQHNAFYACNILSRKEGK